MGTVKTPVVRRFRGEYEFLSNFYPAKLWYEGIAYGNAEAAYQAQKCADPEQRSAFAPLSADEAKRMGRHIAVREDWDNVKIGIMEQIVRAKFEQNPRLARGLLATGIMPLLEGNTWHDVFWGVDLKTGVGENHLGYILMQLRESFRTNGIQDRSSMRPIREYRFWEHLILTDEAMDDVNAAWIVRETDIRAENDSNPGSAVLRCEVALARDTVLVHSPVYGKDDEMCLEECYRNALNLAEEHGVADIAFPALSAGKKCFPKKKAAETAVAAIRNWLLAHRETTMRIWLVPEDARVLELMLESMNAAGAADPGFCGDLAGFVHVDAAEGLTS